MGGGALDLSPFVVTVASCGPSNDDGDIAVERVAVSVTRAFESMRAIRAKRVKDVARFAKDARACGYARTTKVRP